MSIVTFWNDDREQSGKTLTSVAVAVKMAIERNLKILLISTSFCDSTMKNCFWGDETSRSFKFFNSKNNSIAVENGIEGLSKLITSKKLTPNVITDYTKVILKGRLEVIGSFVGAKDKTREENILEYDRIQGSYIELIKNADLYYDMVIVDMDKMLDNKVKEEILKISNLHIYVFSQRLESLNKYLELKNTDDRLKSLKCLPVVGRCMNNTKYNSKNIAKYLQEKKDLNIIPFNTLYYEATEEIGVVDLFLRLRNIKDTTDENYIFMQSVLKLVDSIIKKLKELQKKMR